MKKSNLYNRYLIAVILGFVIVQCSCTKEKGFYSKTSIDASTPLNTYEYLKSKPGVYDSLVSLIDQLGMKEYLTDSNVTLFAVSNSSFQIALNNLNNLRKTQGKPNVFLSELASGKPSASRDIGKAKADSAQLDTMVSYYIIRKSFKSSDFTVGDGQNLFSVRGGYPMHGKRLYADAEGYQDGGSEIIEFANTARSIFVPNWALSTTSSVNIATKNGIVHLIQPDHVFGFNGFVSRLTYIPPPRNLFKNLGSKFTFSFQDPNEFDGRISAGEKFIKLVDGNVLTKWLTGFNPNTGKVSMTWESPEPIVSNVYTFTSANDAQARDMKSWRLEGSLDNINWTTLDTRQDQIFESRFQTKIFDFDNTTPYKFYRMNILTNRGDGLFQVAEWTMNFRQTYK